MYKNSFFKSVLLLASILLFVSCDKDYNVIGEGLIGENHFDLSKYTSNVVAYNEKITPIQSDNLPVNALGIYDNPAFGKTTANFATQIVLSTLDPVIGDNAIIDSVYVEVPYFVNANKTVNNTDGSHVYELDSIYGAKLAKIKLSVYESGYFMRDLDPVGGFQSAQKYFTDQNTDFDNLKIGPRLNDDAKVAQNDAFFFDPAEHKVDVTDATTGKVTTTRTPPSMRLKLNKTFFDSKIIHAPSGSLATNDVFKNYFRGLYFKVEHSGTDPGSLAMINFAKGTITIKYKEDLASTTGGLPTRVEKTIILNMTGNTVSLLSQSNTNPAYSNAMSTSNTTLGDDRLYVKGGEGSLAVIELFGKTDVKGYDKSTGLFVSGANGISDELEDIRHPADGKKWLINEANLVFNIDNENTDFKSSYEPDRIYLFDFTNNRPIIDYFVDGSSAVRPKMAKLILDGNINRDATSTTTPKRGLTYKIRITNQIRNLIKYDDSTNVKLGIVVTEDISVGNSNKLRTPTAKISQAPKASVMNPLGTILYGGAATVPESKKLKLEIYYTKPN